MSAAEFLARQAKSEKPETSSVFLPSQGSSKIPEVKKKNIWVGTPRIGSSSFRCLRGPRRLVSWGDLQRCGDNLRVPRPGQFQDRTHTDQFDSFSRVAEQTEQ